MLGISCVSLCRRLLKKSEAGSTAFPLQWNTETFSASEPLKQYPVWCVTGSSVSTFCTPLVSSRSLSPSSLCSTTGRADGSPSAHRARKSMWIKGYIQQVWRAASIIAVQHRGVVGGWGSPPALQPLGHLAGVLWNDESIAANHHCHRGQHHAGRRRRRLFSFSVCKWTTEQVSVCLCVYVLFTYLFSKWEDECCWGSCIHMTGCGIKLGLKKDTQSRPVLFFLTFHLQSFSLAKSHFQSHWNFYALMDGLFKVFQKQHFRNLSRVCWVEETVARSGCL